MAFDLKKKVQSKQSPSHSSDEEKVQNPKIKNEGMHRRDYKPNYVPNVTNETFGIHERLREQWLCRREQRLMDEAAELSLEQMKYEKSLNETIAKSYEEEKTKLLNLLLFNDDIDYNEIANQLNKICPDTDVANHKAETLHDVSSMILTIIETFDRKILNCKHVRTHLTKIHKECVAIKQNHTYDIFSHEKDEASKFNVCQINEYLVNIQIRGDGNCVWNSVSHSLAGNYEMMKTLRLLTAASLMHFSKQFSETLKRQNKQYSYKHELTLEQLIKDSLSLQSWGDEYHIMALSLALQRPIYSYGSLIDISESSSLPYKQFRRMYKFEQIPNHFKYIGNTNDANNEPILLHYDGSSHYSAVLKTSHDVKPLVPRIQIIDAIIGSEDNEPDIKANENFGIAPIRGMKTDSSVQDSIVSNEIAVLQQILAEKNNLIQHYEKFFVHLKKMLASQTIDLKLLQCIVENVEKRQHER